MHKAPTNKGMGRQDARLLNRGSPINNYRHMMKEEKLMFGRKLTITRMEPNKFIRQRR